MDPYNNSIVEKYSHPRPIRTFHEFSSFGFKNETISAEDKAQFDCSNLRATYLTPPVDPYKWTVDRARDAFLIRLFPLREDRGPLLMAHFVLFYQGLQVRIACDVTSWPKGDAWDELNWLIIEIDAPPSLTKNADEFYSMVEEAIAAHGWNYDSSAIRVARIRMSLGERAHRAAVYARQMADR